MTRDKFEIIYIILIPYITIDKGMIYSYTRFMDEFWRIRMFYVCFVWTWSEDEDMKEIAMAETLGTVHTHTHTHTQVALVVI